ncbi:MAG: alcohol dehydrogenase catalytic domain-containing protein [Candidatus Omnitrophota bacterium]
MKINSMRVAMYYSNKDIRVQEVPVPKISPDELLVKVTACGICGSDVMEWYRADRVPLVLGHEIAGVIVKKGRNVKKYKEGNRISAAHHLPCGDCKYCRVSQETVCETLRRTNFYPGGFSEYLRLPEINVTKGTFLLPDGVSDEEATFIEPLGCVLRGQRQAGLKPWHSLLVIGSGIAGILHIALARARKIKRIIATDVENERLKMAQRFGADFCFNAEDYTPEKLLDINSGQKADVVVIATGALPAIKQALESVDRSGTVLFFAPTDKDKTIELNVNNLFWRNEIILLSTYAANPEEHRQALKFIKEKRINVREMITHRLKLQDTQEGFRLVSEAKESLKVIVNPQD